MPCVISVGERAGWRAVVLENDRLRVAVLTEKGADIYELVDLQTGVDVLFKAPWGLQPRGSAPREGAEGAPFLENYEGGWQELFPSVLGPCTYRGKAVPFHGEVATRRWDEKVLVDDRNEVAVEFSVRSENPSLGLRRVMRLRAADPTLTLEERVDNDGADRAEFVWGHHCVLGPPFIEEGCRLEVSAESLSTLPESWEDTARLRPGQTSRWPMAELRSGELVDLSRVPGTQAGSHDDVFLAGLSEGRVSVDNPRLNLRFSMHFDHRLFPSVVSWQAYGGAMAMPLAGSYALGVEPWTSQLNLEDAVQAGETVTLEAGRSLETAVSVSVEH